LACQCDGKSDHHPLTDAEFDAIAREQGYVKLDLDVGEWREAARRADEALRKAATWQVPHVDRTQALLDWIDRDAKPLLRSVLDALAETP
jgi:hypothetical protein